VALAEGRGRLQALIFTVLTGRVVLQVLLLSSPFVITSVQCIYNYMPETDHGSVVYTVLQLTSVHSLCYM
jgi:hypothetical protein